MFNHLQKIIKIIGQQKWWLSADSKFYHQIFCSYPLMESVSTCSIPSLLPHVPKDCYPKLQKNFESEQFQKHKNWFKKILLQDSILSSYT